MAVVDDLRPTSPKQLQSSEGTLIIEYTPSIARPMKEIELVSTENIKSYKVTFYINNSHFVAHINFT
jgi:hypothetical protein